MRKFFSFIILMLLCTTFMFTGCGIVKVDTNRYLDREVATINVNDKVISITKKELLNSYQNSASTYINMYGYTAEQTVNLLLDNLIERELIILQAKEYFGDLETNNNYIEEYNEVVDEIFEYFDSQVLKYENQLRAIKNLELIEDEEEKTTADTDYDVYEKYTKKVLYFEDTQSYEFVTLNEKTNEYERTYNYRIVKENDEYVRYFFNKETKTFDIKAEQYFLTNNVTRKTLNNYDCQTNSNGNADLTQEAFTMFINNLIKSEEGKNLSKNENEVLQREFDRVKEIYLGNKYVELLKEYYTITTGINNEDILNMYKQKLAESNAKYIELGSEGKTKYLDDMNSSAKDVWYHPYGEQFVQVAHVLVKFTDEQLKQLEEIKNDYKNGIITTYEEYEDKYNAWLETAGTKARYTYVDLENGNCKEEQVGNEYGEVISYKDIYNEINSALTACGNDVEARAIKFNEFVYKYSMDEGSLNQEYYYVVNLDTEVEDKMVKAFADTSRELIEKGAGSLGEPVLVEASNYSGYHIILAIGKVDNMVDISNLEEFGKGLSFDGAIKKLYETKIMIGTDKTLYDALFDLVYKDTFSTYQTNISNTLKDNAKITKYNSFIKDLY